MVSPTSSSGLHFYIFSRSDVTSEADKNRHKPEEENESVNPIIDAALESSPKIDHSLTDMKMIQRALGGGDPIAAEICEKEFGQTLQTITDAVVQQLAKARLEDNVQVYLRGLKIANIKNWKFIANFDVNHKITNLIVGKLIAVGSYTKVYCTLDDRVILVPKKDKNGDLKEANHQLSCAFDNISTLHRKFEQRKVHCDKVAELLKLFDFPLQGFSAENAFLIAQLPPVPEKFKAPSRPILIAPLRTCAKTIFRKAPDSKENVCFRLKIIADVAFVIALAHVERLAHGDIKPGNILVDAERNGFPNDWGGGQFFYASDDKELAASKYTELIKTRIYVYWWDFYAAQNLIATKADVEEFFRLAQARDVYALGLTVVEAMLGLYNGEQRQLPLQDLDYAEINGSRYAGGQMSSRKQFLCVKNISRSTDKKLQRLLDRALNPIYQMRISAAHFSKRLHNICKELKEK